VVIAKNLKTALV